MASAEARHLHEAYLQKTGQRFRSFWQDDESNHRIAQNLADEIEEMHFANNRNSIVSKSMRSG